MAKSRETFNKKNNEFRKQKQRQDKREKQQERKLNAQKGKSLQEMMAYVDENGNISDMPPKPGNKRTINVEDIEIGIPPGNQRNTERKGSIQFFNQEKGFGFIIEKTSGERIFFHNSGLQDSIVLGDKVAFEIQFGEKGKIAVGVKKI